MSPFLLPGRRHPVKEGGRKDLLCTLFERVRGQQVSPTGLINTRWRYWKHGTGSEKNINYVPNYIILFP
ncbi:hypothetical protein R3I94_013882 [Phoxinus phoxinus]